MMMRGDPLAMLLLLPTPCPGLPAPAEGAGEGAAVRHLSAPGLAGVDFRRHRGEGGVAAAAAGDGEAWLPMAHCEKASVLSASKSMAWGGGEEGSVCVCVLCVYVLCVCCVCVCIVIPDFICTADYVEYK